MNVFASSPKCTPFEWNKSEHFVALLRLIIKLERVAGKPKTITFFKRAGGDPEIFRIWKQTPTECERTATQASRCTGSRNTEPQHTLGENLCVSVQGRQLADTIQDYQREGDAQTREVECRTWRTKLLENGRRENNIASLFTCFHAQGQQERDCAQGITTEFAEHRDELRRSLQPRMTPEL